ncbi:MAG: HesA/MoeB/ThiF family protein [Deltaproteobacteria bacterium]|nr:HesA/MoeB/ThiF family protein [Deltaproteobacteria bacterium]
MITEEELRRYQRQIPLFGEAGQEALKGARVLIAGAGGLGTVIALYLAAAGVGTLRIVDCDSVEESNLSRQLLHWSGDLGRPKTLSAAEKLAALNPLVRLEERPGKIDRGSIGAMAAGCDLIVDAMDNFPTRYLLNRAALERGIPLVHGAVRGFYGQATTVIPGRTPCLRCIFPSGPPSEFFPIAGTTCGVIGSIEATEALKLLTGKGEPLAGRLFFWDGLALRADTVAVKQDPACPDCGR